MQKNDKIWTVIRTFNRHELMVSDFLKQEGLTCFIPMRYSEKQAGDDLKPHRVLVPVIHNYVFTSGYRPSGRDLQQRDDGVPNAVRSGF